MTLNEGLQYNPFAAASDTISRYEICDAIIRASNDSDQDAFWNSGAAKVLRVVAEALHHNDPRSCNLVNIRSLLSHFDVFNPPPGGSIFERFILECAHDNELVMEDYRALVNGNPNTVLSFISTADTALSMMASDHVARLTAISTFDFKELRQRKIALFVKVRQQDMKFFQFLLNQFFADLFNALREERPGPDDLSVFCLLDEWGHLTVPDFDAFMATARKYRIGCMIFLQAIEQLEARYGKAEAMTIRQSMLTEIYFGGVDLEMAKPA